MATLDYVKNLREIDPLGEEVVRSAVKRTPEEMQRLEASARAADAENGRYGRYRDQEGNWAIAWQAPGPKTPVVPPLFVSPAAIRRRPGTNELLLVPVEGDPLLISPQQWVVLYEGSANAIIADDEDFRRVMTRQDRVERDRQRAEEGELVQETAPEPPTQPTPAPASPRGASPITEHRTISVDGFIAQVLSDNARLRADLAQLYNELAAEHNTAQNAQSKALAWETQARQNRERGVWMWELITKAMGNEHASDDQIMNWFATLPALPGPPAPREQEVIDALHDAAAEATERPRRSKLSTPPPKEA